MSLTLLDPPTSASVGLITKSTGTRMQFAVLSDAAGGPLQITGTGFGGTTALKALMGGQPFRATPLLKLFLAPVVGSSTQAAAAIMQDVEVTSRTIASSGAAASALGPVGYNWLGTLGGVLFPILTLVAPATGSGGLWAVTIELRNTLVG